MNGIEPNSPEALAKAQKVKSIFMLIAAANIVLVAIVMYARSRDAKRDSPPPPVEHSSGPSQR